MNSHEPDFETEANVLAGLILALDIVHGHSGEEREKAMESLLLLSSDRAKSFSGTYDAD